MCIPSKETAKFLGVIVDNDLNWKGQCAATLTRGQDWLIQFSRVAYTTQGINTKYICQLYLVTAIPCMLYVTNIFLTPQQHVGKQTKYNWSGQVIINKLASIQ